MSIMFHCDPPSYPGAEKFNKIYASFPSPCKADPEPPHVRYWVLFIPRQNARSRVDVGWERSMLNYLFQ